MYVCVCIYICMYIYINKNTHTHICGSFYCPDAILNAEKTKRFSLPRPLCVCEERYQTIIIQSWEY